MDLADALAVVAEHLTAMRITSGVDLEKLAERANVDAERLAGAECGETALDDEELQRVADAYGVPVTALFGGRTTPLSYLAGT